MPLTFPAAPMVNATYASGGRSWYCALVGPPAVWAAGEGSATGGAVPQTGYSTRVTDATGHILLPTNALGTARPAAWTWEAWIKKTTISSVDAMAALFGDQLNMYNRDATIRGNASGSETVNSGNVVSAGIWTHVAISNSTAALGTSRALVNGVLVASGPGVSHSTTAGSGAHRLMNQGNLSSFFFDGYMCFARWWAVQRTDADIAAYYDRLSLPDTTGLIGYWPLNEGTGTAALNYGSAGAAAQGTLTGTAAYVLDAPVLQP